MPSPFVLPTREVVTVAAAALLLANVRAPEALAAAIPPYPPSPAIEEMEWHEVLNFGTDCDNWPTTWADDNHVYTEGGDGNGFGGPRGTWIIRLTGTPPNIVGQNISMIDDGDQWSGIKASGLLSIGGTLYMWARNADLMGHCAKLGRSTNHGLTWTYGPLVHELGYPTFINFGKDYAGARDQYVYTVSHDDSSAYVPSDHYVLLRIPKTQITDMTKLEWFVGLNGSGNPIWSYDKHARGPVFTHFNEGLPRCFRSSIVYNAGLGRYLWWQVYPDPDVEGRFEGGISVYDAPEPWGPWTTVFFDTTWDHPPGDCGSFVPKFTSANGGTMWLANSAFDNLCLRRLTIGSRSVGVAEPAPSPVSELLRAFPNPFSASVRTKFKIHAPTGVRIDVADVRGRRVVTLVERVLPSGTHVVDWNGRDARGARVAAGVYWLRLDVGGQVQSARVVRLE